MKIDDFSRLRFLSAEHKLWQADCQEEEEQQDRHLYRRLHCTARVICFFVLHGIRKWEKMINYA